MMLASPSMPLRRSVLFENWNNTDISITMNTYTHLGLDDAKDEMIRLKELEEARREVEKTTEKPKPTNQNMFRAV